ncbi:unnamed protein product [Darwinula stevensoni]|uniref:RAVE complex protein Rav1 C-terminal domain-containing protein n=1 Tax=Darwinula stevensoni TaxID=69355 RepID=A0A7R8WYL5_9CRUS|nr:unnamed protein product [Darwinula stevensoni]CAG0879086.1 unnamed protein product [Darwinula stevensoni]
MNCHQILTGACNAGDRTFSVGFVEGVPFTAYTAGSNIVILASNFERVQIIPGVMHENVHINCIDSSTDTGKIAAAYRNHVIIYEPVPLILHNSVHRLDYKWVETSQLKADCSINTLAWNLEGTRIITAGEMIQMWQVVIAEPIQKPPEEEPVKKVKFRLGEDIEVPNASHSPQWAGDHEDDSWECIWSCSTPSPVYFLAYSTDGTLFATAGKNDRVPKVWFENYHMGIICQSLDGHSGSLSTTNQINYSFVYLAHPRAVTSLSWRKTSKYMHKGSVANVLVTSCKDNICRIWVETQLPDDGLVNIQQLDPYAGHNPKLRNHRQKHRFMQRLKHMKTCFMFRRRVAAAAAAAAKNRDGGDTDKTVVPQVDYPIPMLPSTFSIHDFHSVGIQNFPTSSIHFHLAASINAHTDIPLVPSLAPLDHTSVEMDRLNQTQFVLHWLNNKEMYFTMQAEQILLELGKKALESEMMSQNIPASQGSSDSDLEANEVDDAPASKTTGKKVGFHLPRSPFHHHNQQQQKLLLPLDNDTLIAASNNRSPINGHLDGTLFPLADTLDRKIETLHRDWHHSPDLLFSIHPIDGSFLVWMVEWLDEFQPGSFRQAQVSFSTRIPNALPLGDAMSMSTNIGLYSNHLVLDLKHALRLDEKRSMQHEFHDKIIKEEEEGEDDEEGSEGNTEGQDEGDDDDDDDEDENEKRISPMISMLSKHANGTLNLWRLTFADHSKYSQVLSIGHSARVCGHRYRVNEITCHPVLPLLLSTSHHNVMIASSPSVGNTPISDNPRLPDDIGAPLLRSPSVDSVSETFCSELILWKVEPVGPLSKSGGVTELARLSSPEDSAFSNCAWIPTLLPSSTLGNLSNSPSACFVASDGHCLRVYQAVIDARALLAEVSTAERNRLRSGTSSRTSSPIGIQETKESFTRSIKIVSQQSTARPGCIILLDAITDSLHDWQNTVFLHVYQEQMIHGSSSLGNILEGAMVDLRSSSMFTEPFYVVLIEKTDEGSLLHMWRMVVSSQPAAQGDFGSGHMYLPDSTFMQEEPNSPLSHTNSPLFMHSDGMSGLAGSCKSLCVVYTCQFQVMQRSSMRLLQQVISALPPSILDAWPPMSLLLHVLTPLSGMPLNVNASYSGRVACAYKAGKSFTRPSSIDPHTRYVNLCVSIYECESTGGSEWVLEDTIQLKNISLPRVRQKKGLDLSLVYDQALREKRQTSVNALVKNFSHSELESLSISPAASIRIRHHANPALEHLIHEHCNVQGTGIDGFLSLSKGPPVDTNQSEAEGTLQGLLAVPSFCTLQTLRRHISSHGNPDTMAQKHLMQLDWVSREDGSHILTVGVGSKILIFTPVSSDMAQANLTAMKESRSQARPVLLKQASSLAMNTLALDEVRWMKLREVTLKSCDGLPPLPMHLSWVREGILVVAMDSEMHVYSQWKPNRYGGYFGRGDHLSEDTLKSRCLTESDLRNLAQGAVSRRMAHVASMASLPRTLSMSSLFSAEGKWSKKSAASFMSMTSAGVASHQSLPDDMPDFGLFEASRIVSPILPQYHPKQLMELLKLGKIRRVKAILTHLVRCISATEKPFQYSACSQPGSFEDSTEARRKSWSRSRALSVSGPNANASSPMESGMIPEELMLDYVEISAIPPLPIWMLLAADKETGAIAQSAEKSQDYSGLFEGEIVTGDDQALDDLLDEEDHEGQRTRRRSLSGERKGFAYFGPKEARHLSRLLTHTHLPGLSSLDQMHLLAIADTVASCNVDFADRFAIESAKAQLAKESNMGHAASSAQDSLDDCGLRFLLAMKHHSYLLLCLPLAQRATLQKKGIDSSMIVWAFHSESEEEMLQLVPSYERGDTKWSELRELGTGWWLRTHTVLRVCVERLAKKAFQTKQDPLDAAIFYLAMKKKSLVWGLFRSVRDTRMTAFFANDFSQERWRKSALKNAFALLGKQRFEHAAAFFLLAGALNDAVEVCLNKLNDLQLAMVICRLYENDLGRTPPSLKKLLYEEILGCNNEGKDQKLDRAHPDPFLRSMAYWMLGEYRESLNTLLLTNVGQDHLSMEQSDKPRHSSEKTDPSVFNFYIYLRTHPLLVRQQLASFAKGGLVVTSVPSRHAPGLPNSHLPGGDSVTAAERRLYFTTAHAHFRSGCPALALEVLCKLPPLIMEGNTRADCDLYVILVIPESPEAEMKETMTEAPKDQGADQFDWSQPVIDQLHDELKLEWSDGEKSDEDEEEKEETKPEVSEKQEQEAKEPQKETGRGQLDIMAQQLKFIACLQILMEELSTLATGCEVDGGQLRFQLYVWLEREVHALKQLCHYGVDTPHATEIQDEITSSGEVADLSLRRSLSGSDMQPTLHEILLADKLDFEAKLKRAARRKEWLKANQPLLRTLLSYCSLHGACGGGLASVRMEIILLLQELQQERSQQQLLSPLPLPTTLPLLAASVATNKTVVNDPVRHLQSAVQDLLQAVIDLVNLPIPGRCYFPRMFVLRDLSIALSACIYQSLCDSDSFVGRHGQHNGMSGCYDLDSLVQRSVVYQNAHLTAGYLKRKRLSIDEPDKVTTLPSKWPGVMSLRALLARESDEDSPRLNILLCESFVAIYLSLLAFGFATCDCHILYRLVSQDFNDSTWATIFGGGVKKLVKVASSTPSKAISIPGSGGGPELSSSGGESSIFNTTKQRLKLNMRLLSFSGSSGSTAPPMKLHIKEDRPTYREMFLPPERSMLAVFMTKPTLPMDFSEIDYDSATSIASDPDDASEPEDLDEDIFDEKPRKSSRDATNLEHSDPSSYSWGILRYAIIRVAMGFLENFFKIAGIEMQDLPVVSPSLHLAVKTLEHWQNIQKHILDSRPSPPEDYIPGCFVESSAGGPTISKYRCILYPTNTPFISKNVTAVRPIKRLWQYLVHQETVQDIFVRYIFGHRRHILSVSDSTVLIEDGGSEGGLGSRSGPSPGNGDIDGPATSVPGPVKIIHKDQDSISSFCINKAGLKMKHFNMHIFFTPTVSSGLMAIATMKEIQELDISLLLEAPAWLEDECEFDILNLNRDPELAPSSGFLVVTDRPTAHLASVGGQGSSGTSTSSNVIGQTGRGTTLLVHHKFDSVKRLSSHPLLPLYLSGSQDGSVSLWEWGQSASPGPLAQPRLPGTYAKVTRVHFSSHGSKFGVSDADGQMSLWQVGFSSLASRPFYTMQCHSKQTSDFVFVGSSSLIATAGHSSESRNVAIWDTLLPQKKALVQAFICHEQGATGILYAPMHQILITGGKKGVVCIWDVRQRQLRHTFQATHHSHIKCLALDPNEEFFVTGSADGDIKVWSLGVHNCMYSFPGEHAKSSFFKTTGQGVTQLHVDGNARLFSCGADGSMKLRQLPFNVLEGLGRLPCLGGTQHRVSPLVTTLDAPGCQYLNLGPGRTVRVLYREGNPDPAQPNPDDVSLLEGEEPRCPSGFGLESPSFPRPCSPTLSRESGGSRTLYEAQDPEEDLVVVLHPQGIMDRGDDSLRVDDLHPVKYEELGVLNPAFDESDMVAAVNSVLVDGGIGSSGCAKLFGDQSDSICETVKTVATDSTKKIFPEDTSVASPSCDSTKGEPRSEGKNDSDFIQQKRKWNRTSAKSWTMDQDIVCWIAEDDLPLYPVQKSGFKKFMGKRFLQKLSGHFKHSATVMPVLRMVLEEKKSPSHELIQDVPTRWTSTYNMLELCHVID